MRNARLSGMAAPVYGTYRSVSGSGSGCARLLGAQERHEDWKPPLQSMTASSPARATNTAPNSICLAPRQRERNGGFRRENS